ncbi:MAG: hypothetical protein AAF564_00205 [Bacteroidota bacterium]
MYANQNALDRDTARQNGMVVIVPEKGDHSILLLNDVFATVELRSLSKLGGHGFGYGIVATVRATGHYKLVLEASSHNDDAGFFFVFPSKTIVAEAVTQGKRWVYHYLEKQYGVDPHTEPIQCKLAVRRHEKATLDRFVQWLYTEQGIRFYKQAEPEEAQRFLPANVVQHQLTADFLGVDHDAWMKEKAQVFLGAVNREQPAQPRTYVPVSREIPAFPEFRPWPVEVAKEGNPDEKAVPGELPKPRRKSDRLSPISWLFKKRPAEGKHKKRFGIFGAADSKTDV